MGVIKKNIRFLGKKLSIYNRLILYKIGLFILFLFLIFTCNSNNNDYQADFENHSPLESSFWIVEKAYGETEKDSKKYFYFVTDTLFIELIQWEENNKFNLDHLSNNFDVNAFFVKSDEHFIMGANIWKSNVSVKFKNLENGKIILSGTNINSDFETTYKYLLRPVKEDDSIRFEYKEYYKDQLHSFLFDTLVSYGLNNKNVRISLKGKTIEEFDVLKSDDNFISENDGKQLYKKIGSDKYFLFKKKYFEDSTHSMITRLKDVKYEK